MHCYPGVLLRSPYASSLLPGYLIQTPLPCTPEGVGHRVMVLRLQNCYPYNGNIHLSLPVKSEGSKLDG
jgi:hypothetical protein